MAVLNPPRSLPGLGRAVVNFLLETRRTWTQEELVEAFKPPGLNEGATAAEGVTHTLLALRAIEILSADRGGGVSVTAGAAGDGAPYTPTQFRRALQRHVLDWERDGDPWQTQVGEGHTSGARDICRALAWLLAQDALGQALWWTENVQNLQQSQFNTRDNTRWAITNDTRWGALSRWAPALGFATPSAVRGKQGFVPLPVVAIDDVLDELPRERLPIGDFLTAIGGKLPVLHGGAIRASLVSSLPSGDPDPGVKSHCADSSVGQVLRILEERGRLEIERLPDAPGVRLSRFDESRHTHVTVKQGANR
jgi:hypothetical protein